MYQTNTAEPQQTVSMLIGADLDSLYTAQRPKVMVVDDEVDTTVLLKHILRNGGFDVFSASNGKDALEKSSMLTPDLVLLDLMMPEMDGWETFRQLRKTGSVPVIVVSAMDGKDTVVECLKMGADDYLTKPFYRDEVVARAQAVLRRTGQASETGQFLQIGKSLRLNMSTREVEYKDVPVELTGKEFAVLAVLARHAPSVVHYSALSQHVWGRDFERARQRIKYLIFLLRKKFSDIDPNQEIIVNVDRLGYKLVTTES